MPAITSPIGGVAVLGAVLFGVLVGIVGSRLITDGSDTLNESAQSGVSTSVAENRLEDVAAAVGTSTNPERTVPAVETLCDVTDQIAQEAGIDGRNSGDRAERVEHALKNNRISVISGNTGTGADDHQSIGGTNERYDQPGTERNRDVSFNHVVTAAKELQRPESKTSQRLVKYLQDPARAGEKEVKQTLSEATTRIDEYDTIVDTLSRLPQDANDAGTRLTDQLQDTDTEVTTQLTRLGKTLSEVANDLEKCENERTQLSTAAETVCTAAADGGARIEGHRPVERLDGLSRAIERGDISFSDSATSTVNRAVNATDPESTLGRSLASALRNPTENETKEVLQDVFEALDELERVRSRLENVRQQEVEDLARTVRSSLSDDTDIQRTLRNRVSEMLRKMPDNDILLFSYRQELNFYHKKLGPELEAEAEEEDADASAQIEAVRERRGEMREQYPRQYDDLNHEIPIHLLGTVSTLLDDADTALRSGNPDRALGVTQAADRLLDAIESLYRENAYHILLRQL